MGTVGLDGQAAGHVDWCRKRRPIVGPDPDRSAAVGVGRAGDPDDPEPAVGREGALRPADFLRALKEQPAVAQDLSELEIREEKQEANAEHDVFFHVVRLLQFQDSYFQSRFHVAVRRIKANKALILLC
jgi:hypothetical protein